MRVKLFLIFIFLTCNVIGQDTLLKKLPVKYTKEYALIEIENLKLNIGVKDLELEHFPLNTYVLIPIKELFETEKNRLEQKVKENEHTNDPNWKTKQKALLDTLENILNKGESIYLNYNSYGAVYKLLNKYSIDNFLNRKKIVLFLYKEDGSFDKLKYKDRRIGAWRHFKIKGAKNEFYSYSALNSTGSIYQSCYDGSSTLLGRIIMNIQRIGW